MFQEATPEDRKKYYTREWRIEKIPDFIRENIHLREFGFDHTGQGPSDRYRFFRDEKLFTKFLRYRAPYAAYSSVALYDRPWKREGWISSELVFDVDAKDIPVRPCKCDNICEKCLDQAKEIVAMITDTLRDDLGLQEIHIIYSGRGYHIRVLDPVVLKLDSEVRSQILRYVIGGDVPDLSYTGLDGSIHGLDHFMVPLGYPSVFTERSRYIILHLSGDEKIEGITRQTMNKILEYRDLIKSDKWGEFKGIVGPEWVYDKLVRGVAKLNLQLVDARVTVDLKRILRLPSSLHSKVSMICTYVRDLESFDPLVDAVPDFVKERV
ncbi:MAG TPA: DNA primase catalytic subunit PriS [Methanothermobacter sp.]|uniref:DNA primase catalytic subunit PriS n=1 Tax=Methanothermobacter tenebrarum TaxID=680118 RepID=UPI0018257756|nr:DNA primase catalytic subunit PriS [Methanothermobacter tenebrarum]MDD3454298.1 DNA primase catalytic subunit PriS [Methanobacteriales archaeon]MDI6881357.1 DNA primase catalytic subunit PriS [Methanothermobacter sp.]MDX9693277.1 DNA primase catalytic subunit PriS [Methanothermobacter sp.]HHW15893.1 DNA primase catalytic subunit PriS [Methanothermobacter sp.]HOQ20333.1 DNA primase catalytic subunit PriS [Methanothermobacter sp.]